MTNRDYKKGLSILNGTLSPDTIFEGLIVCYVVTFICVIIDYLSSTQLWTDLSGGDIYYVYKYGLSLSLAIALDVPCAIAGIYAKKRESDKKIILIACLCTSGLAWLLYAVCRMVISDSYVAGVMMAFIPLLTNAASFIVGFLGYNPETARKKKYYKALTAIAEASDRSMAKLNSAMTPAENEKWVKLHTNHIENEMKNSILVTSANLKEIARLIIAEKAESPEAANLIVDDAEEIAEEACKVINNEVPNVL